MSDQVKHVDAHELKRQLHDGGEIALLDAREEVEGGSLAGAVRSK